MSYFFDAVTVVIIIVSVVMCAKYGFVKSLYRSLGFITALFCALLMMGGLSSIMKSAFVEDATYTFVKNTVLRYGGERGFEDVLEDISRGDPELCASLEHLGIDTDALTEYAQSLGSANEEEALDMLVKKISVPLCNLICDVVAFLIAFFAVFLLIKLLSALLGAFTKIPFVNSVNKVSGGIYGVLLGSVRVGMFAMTMSVIYPLIGSELAFLPTLEEVTDKSLLYGFFSEYNLLSLITNTFI